MVDEATKKKFLKELAKSGNVYLAALKVNISRNNHYRWKIEDKEYRLLANKAERLGRENNCDIAEHALMLKVKDKDMGAIKYLLANNSKRYKANRSSSVLIEHLRKGINTLPVQQKTFEDLIYDQARKNKEIREAEERRKNNSG